MINIVRTPLVLSVLVLAMTAALSGCGVKSAPASVDGADYPRIYPAPSTETINAVPQTGAPVNGRSDTRRPLKDRNGYYTPPPPATETLVR